jgi:serine protease AprX
MRIPRRLLETRVYGAGGGSRFTQDSPIMPDVWFGYGDDPNGALDLLLEPRRGIAPAALSQRLRAACRREAGRQWRGASRFGRIVYEERYVAAGLTLRALLRAALPLSGWWERYSGRLAGLSAQSIERVARDRRPGSVEGVSETGVWFLRLVGPLVWAAEQPPGPEECAALPGAEQYAAPLARLLRGLPSARRAGERPDAMLWGVNRNREAHIAIWDGARTIKADAATRLFSLDCSHLTWAMLDTGIDARHPAFRLRNATGKLVGQSPAQNSRVKATYDFTGIREILHAHADGLDVPGRTASKREAELTSRLKRGQSIAWEVLEPILRVDHGRGYEVPAHPHGTHVAGILAADWRVDDRGYTAHDSESMRGVCPTIRLYDLRVLDDSGKGDEFSILAALQFVRWLNATNRHPVVQGVNLSLGIPHDVANYACGRTPVCQEADRVHDSGVMVVTAAGNEGYVQYLTTKGASDAYQNISITDPGNTAAVLTVGATHRRRPHTYGVSYFSSRGPTGDGRLKPDLVAPGEKIQGPVPDGGSETMDGTSMATPFASGAAALLMSRHPELIGDPVRIKQLLCDTATDLGRERYFQGSGLVDVCRALQSI